MAQPAPPSGDLSGMVRDNSRRMRILEERYSSLRKSLQLIEQNLLKESQKTVGDVKTLESEIIEVKSMINALKEKFDMLALELRETAKKEDVQVLTRYVGMWDPVQFVSHAEVEKIVYRVLSKLIQDKNKKTMIADK